MVHLPFEQIVSKGAARSEAQSVKSPRTRSTQGALRGPADFEAILSTVNKPPPSTNKGPLAEPPKQEKQDDTDHFEFAGGSNAKDKQTTARRSEITNPSVRGEESGQSSPAGSQEDDSKTALPSDAGEIQGRLGRVSHAEKVERPEMPYRRHGDIRIFDDIDGMKPHLQEQKTSGIDTPLAQSNSHILAGADQEIDPASIGDLTVNGLVQNMFGPTSAAVGATTADPQRSSDAASIESKAMPGIQVSGGALLEHDSVTPFRTEGVLADATSALGKELGMYAQVRAQDQVTQVRPVLMKADTPLTDAGKLAEYASQSANKEVNVARDESWVKTLTGSEKAKNAFLASSQSNQVASSLTVSGILSAESGARDIAPTPVPGISEQKAHAASQSLASPAAIGPSSLPMSVPQPRPAMPQELAMTSANFGYNVAETDETFSDKMELRRDGLLAPRPTAPALVPPNVANARPSAQLSQSLAQAGSPLGNNDSSTPEEVLPFDSINYGPSGSVPDASSSSRGLSAAIFNQPEMPRHISHQHAFAMRGKADAAAELHLSPSELGRVRISLSAHEAGMVVSIIADRPETLELMRRHVDQLAQDFRDIGYNSAQFNFGQSTSDQSKPDTPKSDKDVRETQATPLHALTANAVQQSAVGPGLQLDRVDMRV